MVHGATMNGEFAAKMPAACGEILPAGGPAASLPETGGISPVILYGSAGVLALAAGLLLRNSHRRA
jgi:LPXTG-motif cell wall-anchored protein